MFPMAWVLVIRRARPHTAFEALFKIGAGLLTSAFLGGAGGGAVALAGGAGGSWSLRRDGRHGAGIRHCHVSAWRFCEPADPRRGGKLVPEHIVPQAQMQALMSGMGSGQRPPINLSIIHVGNQAQANQEKAQAERGHEGRLL